MFYFEINLHAKKYAVFVNKHHMTSPLSRVLKTSHKNRIPFRTPNRHYFVRDKDTEVIFLLHTTRVQWSYNRSNNNNKARKIFLHWTCCDPTLVEGRLRSVQSLDQPVTSRNKS